MEYAKDKVRLAPLTGPDQIDANRNPYELLNDLVNVAPLGKFIPSPRAYLLQVPDSRSQDRQSQGQGWPYHFPPSASTMIMMITFPRPVRLSEVQIFCENGEEATLPSNVTVRIKDSQWSDLRQVPVKSHTIAPLQGQGCIWIQLKDPTLALSVSIHIQKPVASNLVQLEQIRLLEQIQDQNLEGLYGRITQSNIGIPSMLDFCQSALMDTRLDSKTLLVRIISVLLHFGGEGQSEEGAILMDTLIGRVLELKSPQAPECESTLLEAAVELMRDLCTLPNGRGLRNLIAGLHHLQDLIDHALSLSGNVKLESGGVNVNTAIFMMTLSSTLWSVAESANGRELDSILNRDLFQKLRKWCRKLKSSGNSEMKILVDYLICSVCYCRPLLFVRLMHSIDLLKIKEGTELDGFNLVEKWYNEDSIWTKLEPNDHLLSIDLNDLETLGRCSQSPACAKYLKESSLLEAFTSAIIEFCKTDGAGATEGALHGFKEILRFFQTLSVVKDFSYSLGAMEDLWFPLLKFMSSPPPSLNLKEVEAALIDLLKALCSSDRENQGRILPALRQVISKEDKLSPFSLKLLQQLFFDEWILVHVKSENLITFKAQPPPPSQMNLHPSLKPIGKYCIFFVKPTTTAEEILEMMKDSKNLHLRLASRPEVQVPLHVPMKTLICAARADQSKSISEGHPIPFLDILELSLSKERKQPDQELSKITPEPSCLEVFSQDGGLLFLFQRIRPTKRMGISPEVIRSLRHFLDLPRYSEVLLDEIFLDRTDCLIRLVLGLTNGILNSPASKTLETLPFEALNWLLETAASEQEGEDLRRRMVQNEGTEFILGYLERLMDGKAPVYSEEEGEDEPGQTFQKNKDEEEKVICLLSSLTTVITSSSEVFQKEAFPLLKNSRLLDLIKVHLRNDSVLDIASHIPLYRVILQFLRLMTTTSVLRPLLTSSNSEDSTISGLLGKMKKTVIQYSERLEASKIQDLDLLNLVEDIQGTVTKVEEAVKELQPRNEQEVKKEEVAVAVGKLSRSTPFKTPEDRYVEEMKHFQFAFIEMIADGQVFKVPFHFEAEARRNWAEALTSQRIHSRAKRLAQESTTLSKSLPLSYGSSIFLRCDNDRLDVIKVLITGATGTAYSNGCFEFDVYFPLDYPQSPPKVNFETARGKGLRFGPHIYTDGQVCLSLLNTWEGRAEERWDPKTSSLLPVLVAIQSLILAEDLEETRSKPGYYANIRYLTLQHAILDQISNPPECWKEVIQRHFWLKREEIMAQCEQWKEWSQELDARSQDLFKKTASDLKKKLSKMPQPESYSKNLNKENNLGLEGSPSTPSKKQSKRGLLPVGVAGDNKNDGKKKKENGNCCVQ